ncbi:MAG TPA: prepilin-type N-terminal cleavage/methylation domain-containing protein, partial [Candidatus Ozemobacteraceae bacterium]|nr:prepilin-type N-terminal cleavage/methylation domain-containing protein [Candidatus Ozemobacteraceae bacterium]
MRKKLARYPVRGVTLIEIMLALFILASAMIPIASLMGYGGKATLKDNRHIVGIQVLQQTATLLLQAPYRDIPVGTNLATYATQPILLGDVTGPNGTV